MLRAEKGFIIVGQETDGTVTPDDLGLGWMVSRQKRDFVGNARCAAGHGARRPPAACRAADHGCAVVLEEGAQLVADAQPRVPAATLGHVTSAYWSETLQRSIALALVAGGRARIGSTLYVPMTDQVIPVTVTQPVFH